MCHVTGRLGGFDVGVGSVHSQIAHASVVALVSCVPGAVASFSVLAAIIVGGFSLLLPPARRYAKAYRKEIVMEYR